MKIVNEVNLTNKNPIKAGKFHIIKTIKLSEILNAVCEINNVCIFDVKSKRQFKELATVKREYCYIAWKLTSLTERNPYGNSLSKIGAEVGLDHAIVLYHKKVIINWLDLSTYNLKEKLELIEGKLES